jgi:hypothetical protein
MQSLGGMFDVAKWKQRPYRSPHHTASAVALVGGGCDFSKLLRLKRNSCDKYLTITPPFCNSAIHEKLWMALSFHQDWQC